MLRRTGCRLYNPQVNVNWLCKLGVFTLTLASGHDRGKLIRLRAQQYVTGLFRFHGFVPSEDEETESEREDVTECEYKRIDTESEDSFSETKLTPEQFNQSELNDLVRDLNLPKQPAELLASQAR
ncbi:unnamed protein product [Clavelina lepadiformis]|uniref:Uncharacterized protein n=1 Tax=Clavelina lepadiformis TaxID=159417 RepID=A0ABP0FA56_CLALP